MFSSVTEVSPMTILRQRMLEDLRIRNYAPTTVRCYIRAVAEFAQHFNKPPDQLGAEEVRSWQLFLLNEKRVKLSSYIQAICALRFFYQNTLCSTAREGNLGDPCVPEEIDAGVRTPQREIDLLKDRLKRLKEMVG